MGLPLPGGVCGDQRSGGVDLPVPAGCDDVGGLAGEEDGRAFTVVPGASWSRWKSGVGRVRLPKMAWRSGGGGGRGMGSMGAWRRRAGPGWFLGAAGGLDAKLHDLGGAGRVGVAVEPAWAR